MKNATLFHEHADDILNHELFLQTKHTFSHGAISIYEHSVHVAELAYTMAENNPRIDKRAVIRAGLLHDFFLYEWHIPGLRYLKHGWCHAAIAAEKAREVFGISDHEAACIKTHMWPWTLFRLPMSREAWTISIADKMVAIQETALKRGKRHGLVDPLGKPSQ
ncbi:phosphohydrolase [Spirochaetia bacterium]|nr:phosphohydrolase [Spirochaetia bacterium]